MQYICDGVECRMIDPGKGGAATLISSEPLSDDDGWQAVPLDHLVRLQDGDLSIEAL